MRKVKIANLKNNMRNLHHEIFKIHEKLLDNNKDKEDRIEHLQKKEGLQDVSKFYYKNAIKKRNKKKICIIF